MRILNLMLESFRNIISTKLEFNDRFNFLFGNNGAGKTSLLEAIYFLGMGRSFRSQHSQHLITHNYEKLTIFANIQNEDGLTIPIGIDRQTNNIGHIRVAEENINTHTKITTLMPIQLIAAKDYRLIESGPEIRRQFLDWGVFHMEHSFLSLWQKMRQSVRQRNALLKQKPTIDYQQINFWNKELDKVGVEMHELRNKYLTSFIPLFDDLMIKLLGNSNIKLEYYAGWNDSHTLQEALAANLEKDLRSGFTGYGPHRADIRLKINNNPAQDILSRGQQKLLIYALRLSQGLLLKKQKNADCVYLIDDLPSELDREKCQEIFTLLLNMNNQVFITAINSHDFVSLLDNGALNSSFHVKHGNIEILK